MKRFIFAIILVLAFCADSFALNLRPYMQTPPEVQVFAKRVIEDGGQIVDLEFCQKYTRLSKQLLTWSNGKFVGDANMGVKLDASGVSVQTLYDLSGNNNDAVQATVGNQPVWTQNVQGGRAGLVFDGINDILITANTISISGNTPRTLQLCFLIDPITIHPHVFGWGDQASLNTMFKIIVTSPAGSTGTWTLWGRGGGNDWETAISVTAGAFMNHVITYDGATADWFRNGLSSGTSNHVWITTATTAEIGKGAIEGAPFTGKVLTSSIFNAALTTAQRTALESFVDAYYSIY